MAGTYDTVAQFLATNNRTVRLPNFSFREIKNSAKYEIIFGKYEGITFPGEEIPSIFGFKGIPDGYGIHIGYKMIPTTANRLIKKWWNKRLLWWFSCRPLRWKAFNFYVQKHYWVSVCWWCKNTIVKSHWFKTAFEKRQHLWVRGHSPDSFHKFRLQKTTFEHHSINIIWATNWNWNRAVSSLFGDWLNYFNITI